MQSARELEKVVGVIRVASGKIAGCSPKPSRGRSLSGERCRWRGGTRTALQLVYSRVTGNHTLTQFVVLLTEPSKFHDDLIEKIVNLILVITFTKLGRLESFIDHIFGS